MLVKRWLPAIIVMVLIFCFSSLPEKRVGQLTQPGIDFLNKVVEKVNRAYPEDIDWLKIGHVIGYALLAIAFRHALMQYPRVKIPNILSPLFSFLYSITDEFHQIFVPGRSSELRDILIDTSAASLAILLILIINKITGLRKLVKTN